MALIGLARGAEVDASLGRDRSAATELVLH